MLPLAISNGDFGGAVDAAGAQRPLIGENDAREELELFDHTGQPLSAKPKMEPVVQRCQKSLQTLLKEGDTEYKKLTFYPDALAGVSVEPRALPDDPRLVYFVLTSRPSAAAVVERLLRSLYHPSHLFLLHADLKMNASNFGELAGLAALRPNVHLLKTRRMVQWGGFSMVLAMLDGLASFVDRIDFDFFLNIADSELSLRTNEEVVGPSRGRCPSAFPKRPTAPRAM